MKVSTFGLAPDLQDVRYTSAVLQLARVSVDGVRVHGCRHADDESGIVICTDANGHETVRERPDLGYRMVELRGEVRIG